MKTKSNQQKIDDLLEQLISNKYKFNIRDRAEYKIKILHFFNKHLIKDTEVEFIYFSYPNTIDRIIVCGRHLYPQYMTLAEFFYNNPKHIPILEQAIFEFCV